jgi:hypothetical protein
MTRLITMPRNTKGQTAPRENQASRELSISEVEQVSGGFKWERGVRSGDVIDARGGSFTLFGYRFDIGG